MIREDARRHRFQKTHATLDAVAAFVPDRRRPSLRRMLNASSLTGKRHSSTSGSGEARVRHVRLNRIRAVEVRPGAGAAGNGFVILVLCHRRSVKLFIVPWLAASTPSAPYKQSVTTCRSLDVAGNDGGWVLAGSAWSPRHDDVQRLQAAGVHRNLIVHQRSEHVQHGRSRDRRPER